jgi:hypothetical protein
MVGRFAERMREGVLAASVPIGLEVLDELMQSEVVELAGPKVKHNPDGDGPSGSGRSAPGRGRVRTAQKALNVVAVTAITSTARGPGHLVAAGRAGPLGHCVTLGPAIRFRSEPASTRCGYFGADLRSRPLPAVRARAQTDAAPEQRPNYRRQLCVSIETGPPARSHCDADGGWEQEEAAATTDGEGRADASAGACGSSHVGGDDVGGVAVERSAGTVVAAGLPWVGMPCVVLHIPETAPGVQGCGDRGVAQRVW